MTAVLERMSDMAWGPFPLLVLVLFGGWLTAESRAAYIIKAPFAVKRLFSKEHKGEITPFMTLSNALAATMGTGNIVGVATAVSAGGAGALFWMQAAAFFGMMIKFSEAALAVKFKAFGAGPMGYLSRIRYIGRPLAYLFAAACALASIGSGCITQSNSAAGAMTCLSVRPAVCAVFFGIICLLATGGGVKGLMRLSAYVIPFITVGYISMAAAVAVKFRADLGGVISDILKAAFCFRSAAGGAAGYTVRQAVRYGLSRGIFSNEAGMGSSAIAYSLSGDNDAKAQGMLAVAEVFIDTVLCCSLTGIVLLLSKCELSGYDGTTIAINAFSSALGGRFGGLTAVFIAIFGLASVCGWFTFGCEAVRLLFADSKPAMKAYRYIYAFAAAAGAVTSSKTVWLLSDTLTGIMLIINVLGMILLADEIKDIISP